MISDRLFTAGPYELGLGGESLPQGAWLSSWNCQRLEKRYRVDFSAVI